MRSRRWFQQLHWQIIFGLLLGVLFGLAAAVSGWGRFTQVWIAPLGTVFINLLKLIAVPLVLTSLACGVASLSDLHRLSRMGGKTIGLYLLTTILAIMIGLLMVNLLEPGRQVPPNLREELQQAYLEDTADRTRQALETKDRGPLQFLVDAVPENVVEAASDNRNMLQIVILALLLGVGLIQVPRDKARPVLEFLAGLNEVLIRLVDLIMHVAPIGVFSLMSATITSVAGDDPGGVVHLIGALGYYCLAVVVGFGLQTFLVYPLFLRFGSSLGLGTFLKGVAPAQLVAFSTSSSGATLPVTMECAQENLGVSEEVSSFVLPLGATINMDGTALYQAVATVFIAQAIGMHLGATEQLTIIFMALLASIGTAAIPSAGIIMLVIILEADHVPSAGIALILGVDRILDMLRTVTNITGDAMVATVVAASEGALHLPHNQPSVSDGTDT
ncbi:MAG TPA: dicarboxylate/amino acid:cation symporter [Acidobacteriota bacterium]|nr:dicarboxylate/amino acid:cation symporter [Acidobacteriota bacterium]